MTVPAVLSRYTQDLSPDGRAYARYIGNLEQGRSNLSLNSSLTQGDRQDWFRFRVTENSYLHLTSGEVIGDKNNQGAEVAPDGTVRYRLLSPSGRVIADSDPNAGAAHDAWVKLTSDDNLKLSKGTYNLQVSRGKSAVDVKNYIYSLTMRSNVDPVTADAPNTAIREFLTTETPPTAASQTDLYGNTNVTAVLGLFADVRVL